MGSLQSRQLDDLEVALAALEAGGLPALQGLAREHCGRGQSPTALFVPGLLARPWWSEGDLGEECRGALAALQKATEEVAAECRALRAAVTGPAERVWPRWFLIKEGKWVAEHCQHCPQTERLLRALPLCDAVLGCAYFSVLPPEACVGEHCGATNTKLRLHLALSTPAPGADCAMEVAGERRAWQRGGLLVFDDSFPRRSWNRGGAERLVLLCDLWHPGLARPQLARLRAQLAAAPAREELRARHAAASLGSGAESACCPSSAVQRQLAGRAPVTCLLLAPLAVADVAQAACTCKLWRGIGMCGPLWASLLLRDFMEKACSQQYARYRELCPRLERWDDLPRDLQADMTVKILVAGDQSVGKTSFVTRCADHQFPVHPICTIGVDFKILRVRHRGLLLKVQLWDMVGPERFGRMEGMFRRIEGVIVMYDQSCSTLFHNVQNWVLNIRRHAAAGVPIILCACKADLAPAVTEAEGQAMAAALGVDWAVTSSKTGQGVERVTARMMRASLEFKALQSPAGGAPAPARQESRMRPGLCCVQ